MRAGILPVWLFVIAGSVAVGMASPRNEYFTWLPIVLAAAVLLTFVVQLAVPAKQGIVVRIMASVCGSVVLLGLATAVLWASAT